MRSRLVQIRMTRRKCWIVPLVCHVEPQCGTADPGFSAMSENQASSLGTSRPSNASRSGNFKHPPESSEVLHRCPVPACTQRCPEPSAQECRTGLMCIFEQLQARDAQDRKATSHPEFNASFQIRDKEACSWLRQQHMQDHTTQKPQPCKVRADRGCSGCLKRATTQCNLSRTPRNKVQGCAGLGLGWGDMPRGAEAQEAHSQQHVLGAHGFLQNSEVSNRWDLCRVRSSRHRRKAPRSLIWPRQSSKWARQASSRALQLRGTPADKLRGREASFAARVITAQVQNCVSS